MALLYSDDIANHYSSIKERLVVLLCVFVVSTMPFSITLHSGSIGILLIYSLSQWGKWRQIKFKRPNIVLLLPMILFLVYLVNAFRAENLTEGFAQVEKRSPLILFPMAFILIGNRLNEHGKDLIIKSFILLVIVISIICYGNAFMNVISNNSFVVVDLTERDYYYFSYLYLVSPTKLDPIYMSLYANICVAYLLFYEIKKNSVLRFIVLIYLCVFVALISSKIGIAVLVIVLLWRFISRIFESNSSIKKNLYYLLTLLFLVSLLSLPFIKERLWQSLEYDYSWEYSGLWNSSSQRLAIWNSAIETLQNSPLLGYGTSNGQLELEKIYKQNGYIRGYEDHYNAHNEYIHTALESGVVGLTVLVFVLAYPLLKYKKEMSSFGLVFLIIMAIYFTVEVVLARQKGISMFAFFYCIIFVDTKNGRDEI